MKKMKGFTLIEVVVALTVLTLLLVGVYSIFNTGIEMFAKDRTQVANQESIRTVMSIIEKKIRMADNTYPLERIGDCLQINTGASDSDTFCFSSSNGTISHNGVPILDRIALFDIEVTNSSIVEIKIESIFDSMGQNNRVEAKFFARQGR